MNLEISIFQVLRNLANQSAFLDWLVVFLGNYSAYILAVLVIWWLWREKNWRLRCYYFSFLALTAILSRAIATPLIRFIRPRPRPFEVLDFSPLINHDAGPAFPSGHSAFFFALAFGMYFAGYRKRGLFLFAAAFLMGVARVIAGVHWPLDIAAGALLGLISALVVRWLLPRTLISKKIGAVDQNT